MVNQKTDRELLEDAAKAAGIDWCKGGTVPQYPDMLCLKTEARFWRPLDDDGDALRLAVKLGLVVCVMNQVGFTGVYIPSEHIYVGGKYDEMQHHDGDPCAASRRAIVRAAAEIGNSIT